MPNLQNSDKISFISVSRIKNEAVMHEEVFLLETPGLQKVALMSHKGS